MRIYDLDEGVTFKKKQENEALNRDDINVGIEYEFLVFYNDKNINKNEAEYILKDENIPYISDIKAESHQQVELITEIMNINQALKHMKLMFSYFNDRKQGISLESIGHSGMHISISYKNYKLENINFLKFALLMSSKYFTSIFPEREYVKDFDRIIDSALQYFIDKNDKRPFAEMIPDLERQFEKQSEPQGTHIKYHGIKLSDYAIYDGRIELRFFGGKGYENRYDEIKKQLARAIHILGISYTDMHDDVYYRELYKRYNKLLDKQKYSGISARIEQSNTFNSLWKEDKDLFVEATKQMKDGNMPPDGMSIQDYFKLVKKFFPKKLDSYIKINEYIPKLSANRVVDLINYEGLTDNFDAIINKFSQSKKATIIYAFFHMNSDLSMHKALDIVGDDNTDIMVDYLIDDIDTENLNKIQAVNKNEYFKYIIFPISGMDVDSIEWKLYEMNALSSKTQDRITNILESSIEQMKEKLQSDEYIYPSLPHTHRVYELLGREDEFVELVENIFEQAKQDINSDKEDRLYKEKMHEIDKMEGLLSYYTWIIKNDISI